MVTEKKTKKVVVTEKLTDDDKILGKTAKDKTETIINYKDTELRYKVTNLQMDNEPMIVRGDLIETFIGMRNNEARNELKKGANEVITKDYHGNDEYKIEVIG